MSKPTTITTTIATLAALATLVCGSTLAAAPPDDMVKQCQRLGGDWCTLIVGTLAHPGQNPMPASDQCARIDRTTGSVVETWPPSEKIHIFWTGGWRQSGWFISCSRSWWPFS